MNDAEKKIYREELKKKLKNKQNEKKMIRTNNINKNKNVYDDSLSKISDMMKNLPNDILTNNIESNTIESNTIESNTIESNTIKSNTIESNTNPNKINKINNLDKINYIINKNYNDIIDQTNDSTEQIDNLEDYLIDSN